jgi:hypothetical protein
VLESGRQQETEGDKQEKAQNSMGREEEDMKLVCLCGLLVGLALLPAGPLHAQNAAPVKKDVLRAHALANKVLIEYGYSVAASEATVDGEHEFRVLDPETGNSLLLSGTIDETLTESPTDSLSYSRGSHVSLTSQDASFALTSTRTLEATVDGKEISESWNSRLVRNGIMSLEGIVSGSTTLILVEGETTLCGLGEHLEAASQGDRVVIEMTSQRTAGVEKRETFTRLEAVKSTPTLISWHLSVNSFEFASLVFTEETAYWTSDERGVLSDSPEESSWDYCVDTYYIGFDGDVLTATIASYELSTVSVSTLTESSESLSLEIVYKLEPLLSSSEVAVEATYRVDTSVVGNELRTETKSSASLSGTANQLIRLSSIDPPDTDVGYPMPGVARYQLSELCREDSPYANCDEDTIRAMEGTGLSILFSIFGAPAIVSWAGVSAVPWAGFAVQQAVGILGGEALSNTYQFVLMTNDSRTEQEIEEARTLLTPLLPNTYKKWQEIKHYFTVPDDLCSGFTAWVACSRDSYAPGDPFSGSFFVSEDSHVTITHDEPSMITLLFDGYVSAGEHSLAPPSGMTWVIVPPKGVVVLEATSDSGCTTTAETSYEIE